MGFEKSMVEASLQRYGFDEEKAISHLLGMW